MKYVLEIEIAVPRARLFELFDDPDNWPKWQQSFISAEPSGGVPREVGGKTDLVHKVGGRKTEMTELIEAKHFPEKITCIYEAKGAWNRVSNRFVEIDPTRTRWIFGSEFRCTGILRIMSLLMPGMFRKSSLKEMASFKKFAEKEA